MLMNQYIVVNYSKMHYIVCLLLSSSALAASPFRATVKVRPFGLLKLF
jgi:hypothetical protein